MMWWMRCRAEVHQHTVMINNMLPSLINLPDHMKDAEVRLTNNRNSTDYLAKQLNSTNRGLREI